VAQFKFRLATLLKLRERHRDERREQLAEAYRAQELLEERKSEIDAEIKVVDNQVRHAAGAGVVKVDQLVDRGRYELILKAELHQLATQSKKLEEEIDRRRTLLIDANRQVRVLEKLSEKQEARHREEFIRREQKVYDEIACQRAAGGDPWAD